MAGCLIVADGISNEIEKALAVDYRQCGDSDLKLSALGTGCWAFGGGGYWGEQSQRDVEGVVHRSVELGVNYFDTAEAYNAGRSEASLGDALRAISRDRVIIGTKVAPSNTSPETLVAHCEASLRRLRTDYVDLYMVHWPIHPRAICHFTDDDMIINAPPSTEKAFETLGKLREQGKIRYIGVSNYGVERFKQVRKQSLDIVANELPYSLLTRAIELHILPYCQQAGVGIIGYMTLLQGVLTHVHPTLDDVPPHRRRTRHFTSAGSELCRHGGEGAEKETSQALTDIHAIAEERGLTVSEIAIKWALANPGITCALVGARNVRQLESNVKAALEPLPAEIVQKLNAATKPLMDRLGPSFDYYESLENDRT